MLIEYAATAGQDIRDIRQHYLDAGGRALALRMVRQIREEIAILATHPHSAPAYDLVPGVRRLVVANGAYLVFYHVTERVEVLHVRRSERTPADVEDCF